MNGQPVGYEEVVVDGAEIEFAPRNTLQDLLELFGAETEEKPTVPFTYYFNGELHSLPASATQVLINGETAPADTVLKDGDRVEFCQGTRVRPRLLDIFAHQEAGAISTGRPITVMVNKTPVIIPGTPGSVRVNGTPARETDLVPEGAMIEVDEGADASAYFAEIFNHVPMIVPERPSGKRLITLLNGEDAEYTAPLKDGDEIEIFWEGERP
jgi:sulfur carrier protein ThiS